MANYYVEKNLVSQEEIFSPSGKYRLLIRYYTTKKGSWNYSRGTIYRVSDGKEIADIKRNYSAFHHSFVTKDDEEYLISGRSYMNQCIVNLDAEAEYERSDKELMDDGVAFCWAQATLSPDGNTLIVDGCYWACPYEYKFFDFTDPSEGWPELEIETDDDEWPYADEAPPRWIDAKTAEVFKSEEDEDERIVNVRRTFERRGNKVVLIDKWVSEQELERRQKQKEWQAKNAIFHKEFESNPIWLEIKKLTKELDLERESYNGWRYWKNNECNVSFLGKPRATLRWEVTGESPICISWYVNKKEMIVEFERSIDGVTKAMHRVKEIQSG